MTKEQLSETISKMCPSIRPPRDMVVTEMWDCYPERHPTIDAFDNLTWKEVNTETLLHEYDIVCYLTCEAMSFYAPAFLVTSLLNGDSAWNVLDSVFSHYGLRQDRPELGFNWHTSREECFESMSSPVSAAVCLYFRWWRDEGGFEDISAEAARALDDYWALRSDGLPWALQMLGSHEPIDEKVAKELVEVLDRTIRNPRSEMTAETLDFIEPRHRAILPFLCAVIRDKGEETSADSEAQTWAVRSVGRIGGDIADAVPDLEELSKGRNRKLRKEAAVVLRKAKSWR